MAKFDAGQISSLSYDFSAFVKDKDQRSGVIEEPSALQVAEFQIALRSTFADEIEELEKQKGVKTGELTQQDLAALMTNITKEKLMQKNEQIFAAVSAVCSGRPSADTLSHLPWRVSQRFIGWVSGELTNPED